MRIDRGWTMALCLSSTLALLPCPARAAEPASAGNGATPAGVTFTVPEGWKATAKGALVVLEPPEGDTRIALADVHAANADAAVATGWASLQPGFDRPLQISVPQAARDGWQERQAYQYETSPNERRVVSAFAWRADSKADLFLVVVVDGSEATLEKRGAQAGTLLQSVRPKGYTRESFAGRKAHPLDAERLALLRSFVEEGRKLVGTPGVGLAFLDGGKTVWAGGLGVKELGKPAPVDGDTLFLAASNTKALTTLLLAELVDEGKLAWNQPVTEVFPSFRLGNAATTKQVEVRHLVCACTGMPRQDMEWLFEYEHETPDSVLALLGTMQPTSGFGELFQYSNLMAAAAGYVAAHRTAPGKELGAAYDEAMRTKVFAPLGMTTTTFDYAKALAGNAAQPHGEDVDGAAARGRMDLNYSAVPIRPAGAVWTSARELAKYVEMELAKGLLPDGGRLVSEANLLARYAPQVQVGEDVTYGMALMVDRRWGVPVVHHGGDLAGYHSDMIWLPEQGVGAVILTNGDTGYLLRGPLLRRLLEVLFDGQPEAEAQLRVSVEQHRAAVAKARERLTVPADPKAVAQLAARYSSAELGTLDVRREGGTAIFDVGEWRSAVASRRNDDGTISFVTIDPTLGGFEFVVASGEGTGGSNADRGRKRRLIVRDAQHEYVFEETPPGKR
ncbi:MAG: serine hydrolase domain-containing protein [Thermoanaerobaculia bacterium]